MSPTSPSPAAGERTRVAGVVERIGAFWTLGVLLALIVAFGIMNPNFISRGAWLATSTAATGILLLSLGQTFVIATAGIDLSVGAVLGLSGFVGAWTMSTLLANSPETGGAVIVAIGMVAGVAGGAVAGFINGLVITRMGVTPLIATLGMLGIATGTGYLIGHGQPIASIPEETGAIGFTNVFGWFPVPVLVALGLAIACSYALNRTRFGRRTLAIGSNVDAARRAGINVGRHLTAIYAVSGALAGVGGMLLVTRLSAASPGAGSGQELNSIAAVVIGGTSLMGGRASIAGSVVGAYILAVIQTGLVVAAVDPFWQFVAVGVVLVLAVWADRQRTRLVSLRH